MDDHGLVPYGHPGVDVAFGLVDVVSRTHHLSRLQKLPQAAEVEGMHLAEVPMPRDEGSRLEAQEQNAPSVLRKEAEGFERFPPGRGESRESVLLSAAAT